MTGYFDLPRQVIHPVESRVQRYSTARPKSWGAFVVMVAVAVSLFCKFPPYTDVPAKSGVSFVAFAHTLPGKATAWWLEHPFQVMPVDVLFPPGTRVDPLIAGAASHGEKLTFRAFIPLLNQVTRGGLWTLVGANHLAAILTFFLIYQICFRVTSDALLATGTTWAYAACWSGAWGFNDMGFGDAVGIALLLATLATNQSWLITALVLAATLTDERAMCAAPLVVLFRCWEASPPFAGKSAFPGRAEVWKATTPVLSGILIYGLGRLLGGWIFQLKTGTSMMATTDILLYHFYVSYPAKIFSVFEFLWAFPLLLLWDLVATPGPSSRSRWIAGLALMGAAAPAFMVWDVDRSLCYFLPGILLALCFSSGAPSQKSRRTCVIFAASFLWMAPYESWMRYLLF